MSRAFVKESDSASGSELPDRPISPHANYVTPAGLAQLRQRLAEANQRKQALAAAGDDIEAADALRMLRRDLRWLEARVGSARLVDPAQQPRDRVAFGATVEVADADGEHEFRIVGEDEADAEQGRISYVSPLARALLGARVGDEVVWKRPAGDLNVELLAIRYDDSTAG